MKFQTRSHRKLVATAVTIALTAVVSPLPAAAAQSLPDSVNMKGTTEQLSSPLQEACVAAKEALLEENGAESDLDATMFCGLGRITIEFADGKVLSADLPVTGDPMRSAEQESGVPSIRSTDEELREIDLKVNQAAERALADEPDGEWVSGPSTGFFCPYFPDRNIKSSNSATTEGCAYYQAEVNDQLYVRYVLFSWVISFGQFESLNNTLGVIATHDTMSYGVTLQNQKQNYIFIPTDVGQNHYVSGIGYSNGNYTTGGLGTQGTGSYASRLEVRHITDTALNIPGQNWGTFTITPRFHCEDSGMYRCEYPNGAEAPL